MFKSTRVRCRLREHLRSASRRNSVLWALQPHVPQNGRVTRTSEIRPNDLWTRLDAYLRSNKVKLQEVRRKHTVYR